jgi:hypothetical protein
MPGASHGMFKFGCSSAYGPHSYSVLQQKTGTTGTDNVEFRSYLYTLISQASKPRQADEQKPTATINEIFPGIRMGPESVDVTIICAAFCLMLGLGIGGCYLLGWIVDAQAREARLQIAEEYAARHPNVVQEFEPQAQPQYSAEFGVPSAQQPVQLAQIDPTQQGAVRTHFPQHQRREFYTSANGVPGITGIAGGAPVYRPYAAASSGSLNGTLRNDQVYMYWR